MNLEEFSKQLQSVQPGRRQLDAEHTDAVLHQLFPEFDSWWRDEANCRTMSPEAFHLARGAMNKVGPIAAICGQCPVRAECLSNNLRTTKTTEMHGIVAGMTPHDRRNIVIQVKKRNPLGAISLATAIWQKTDAKLGSRVANSEPYFPQFASTAQPREASLTAE